MANLDKPEVNSPLRSQTETLPFAPAFFPNYYKYIDFIILRQATGGRQRSTAKPQPRAWHGHPSHDHHGQDARATSRVGTSGAGPRPNAVRPYEVRRYSC